MALLTPKEKLFAVYNALRAGNGQPAINPDDFDMSPPQAYAGPRSNSNSVFYLQPKASSPSFGLATIYYNRVNLSSITTIRISKGSASTFADLLTPLNTELGLSFALTDFASVTIPAAPGSFTLTATTGNLILTGSTTITLDV